MIEACIRSSKEEPKSYKRNAATGSDRKVLCRKIADYKNDWTSLADGLRRETFDPFASIQYNEDQLLVVVSKCIKDIFNGEKKGLQHSVHDVLCNAARGV